MSKNSYNLVIDGRIFFLQVHGGISNLFFEILPRMCDLEPNLQIVLITEHLPKHLLPTHNHILHRALPELELYLRPNRVWNKVFPPLRDLLKSLIIRDSRNVIWHSTEYTFLKNWKGAKVFTIYDMIFELYPNLFADDLVRRYISTKSKAIAVADTLICISETTKQDLIDIYDIDPEQVVVIPLACSNTFGPIGTKQRSLPNTIQCPFVLYVGNRHHHKNFVTLAKAFKKWKRNQEFELVTVGGQLWSKQELALLEELNISNRIKRLPNVDDELLCSLYNSAEAFVFPSIYEGFGIPLLEAMSSGCPIVASHIPSTIEVAGEVPFYFDAQNVDELVDQLECAVFQGKNGNHVNLGFARAKDYSWDWTARQTLETYKRFSIWSDTC